MKSILFLFLALFVLYIVLSGRTQYVIAALFGNP